MNMKYMTSKLNLGKSLNINKKSAESMKIGDYNTQLEELNQSISILVSNFNEVNLDNKVLYNMIVDNNKTD